MIHDIVTASKCADGFDFLNMVSSEQLKNSDPGHFTIVKQITNNIDYFHAVNREHDGLAVY